MIKICLLPKEKNIKKSKQEIQYITRRKRQQMLKNKCFIQNSKTPMVCVSSHLEKNRVKDSGNKNISLMDYLIQSTAFLLQSKPIRNEIKQFV